MEGTKKNQMEILETKNVKTEKILLDSRVEVAEKKSPKLKIDQ